MIAKHITVSTNGIVTGKGILCGVTVTGGTAVASVKIFDNAAAQAGTVVAFVKTFADQTAYVDFSTTHRPGVSFGNGLSATLTGTGAEATLYVIGDTFS